LYPRGAPEGIGKLDGRRGMACDGRERQVLAVAGFASDKQLNRVAGDKEIE
jgi:hypothetical protein